MGNRSGTRYVKFFRRLIANSQPKDIDAIVERYTKDLEATESNYLDIVIHSNGALSYEDVMRMPVSSLRLYVQRINHLNEQRAEAAKKSRRR